MADLAVPEEMYGRKINEAERLVLLRRAEEQKAKEEMLRAKAEQERMQQEAEALAKQKAAAAAAQPKAVPLSDRRALFGDAAPPSAVIKIRAPMSSSSSSSKLAEPVPELSRSSSVGSLNHAPTKPPGLSLFSVAAPRSNSSGNVNAPTPAVFGSSAGSSAGASPPTEKDTLSAASGGGGGGVVRSISTSSISTSVPAVSSNLVSGGHAGHPMAFSSTATSSSSSSSSSTRHNLTSTHSAAIPELTVTRAPPSHPISIVVSTEQRPRSHSACASSKDVKRGEGKNTSSSSSSSSSSNPFTSSHSSHLAPSSSSSSKGAPMSSSFNALTLSSTVAPTTSKGGMTFVAQSALAKSDDALLTASSNPTTPMMGRRDKGQDQGKGAHSGLSGGGGGAAAAAAAAPALAAPVVVVVGGGGEDLCQVCQNKVYKMEEVRVDSTSGSLLLHKWCFRCHECNGKLSLGSYAAVDGLVYCKPHFKQLFSLKGNYNEGFGSTQRKHDFVKGLTEDDSTA